MHRFNKFDFLCLIVLALSSFGVSQTENFVGESTGTASCTPPAYGCARSDLIKTDNLNPAPNMSAGKNTVVTPSDFNLPIVRVTDGKNYQNRTMTVTFSGSNGDNIFNTNDTYLVVDDEDGWRYPVALDPATMQVQNASPWVLGANQVRWAGSGSFSRVNPNTFFGVLGAGGYVKNANNGNSTTLYKISLSGTTSVSASGVKIFDFASCPGMPNPYNIGRGMWRSAMTVSAGDKRFAQAFSNQGGQNTGGDVTVYDATSGHCYRYDTAHARLCTSAGCVPMSLPDKFTVHEVYMSLDGNYLRITFGKCISGSCSQTNGSHPYFWEIGTPNVVLCSNTSHSANCAGHMVEGYTHVYNTTVWPITGRRAFTDPFSYTLLNATPALDPITDQHYSNNAADPDDTAPIWVTNVQNVRTAFGGEGCNRTGNPYEGCVFPEPLYGEIFGITQRGGYIRAAHSYNSGSSPYFNCKETIGAVSQTGRFFAWSSDWLTTLGKDNFGHNRCDVFIVHLAAEQGAAH